MRDRNDGNGPKRGHDGLVVHLEQELSSLFAIHFSWLQVEQKCEKRNNGRFEWPDTRTSCVLRSPVNFRLPEHLRCLQHCSGETKRHTTDKTLMKQLIFRYNVSIAFSLSLITSVELLHSMSKIQQIDVRTRSKIALYCFEAIELGAWEIKDLPSSHERAMSGSRETAPKKGRFISLHMASAPPVVGKKIFVSI